MALLERRVVVLSAAAIICAVSILLVLQGDSSTAGDRISSYASHLAGEEMFLPVRTVRVRRGSLVQKLRFPGEAISPRRIEIRAEVSGVLKSLNIKEGQRIRRGEMLAIIEDAEYRLELEEAEVERLRVLSEFVLENKFTDIAGSESVLCENGILPADEDSSAFKEMYERGVISKMEFEKRRRRHEISLIESGHKKEDVSAAVKGLSQAEIGVRKAHLILEKTRIKAPFWGIICDIQVSPQEHVMRGKTLCTLVDISQIKILVKVLESEISLVGVGQSAEIRFSSYRDQVFKGKVESISPVVNPEKRTCNAILAMDNPRGIVKPGMYAEVDIVTDIHQKRLLVPQEALLMRGGRKLIFVVENGFAKWRYVKTGRENREDVEILEDEMDGIREGDHVIVDGHFTLAHDTRVKIID